MEGPSPSPRWLQCPQWLSRRDPRAAPAQRNSQESPPSLSPALVSLRLPHGAWKSKRVALDFTSGTGSGAQELLLDPPHSAVSGCEGCGRHAQAPSLALGGGRAP